MPSLSEIVSYTDRFLRIRDVGDWDNAVNGLQIENSGRVTRIGAAVDVSTRVLTEAAKKTSISDRASRFVLAGITGDTRRVAPATADRLRN
jgi:hypothetical protein